MKIMTVLGTRPEIIRLSQIIPLLDEVAEHVLVHTGQNYDDRLDGVFFRELGVRAPDSNLAVRGSGFADQIGQIIARIEPLMLRERPDRLLILGDTNSGLTAIVARRLGIPVYHMEAGNRCFDDRVPEEVNRRIIDHSSSVLMPYTSNSRENLIREGFASNRIFVSGNPIKEVIDANAERVEGSSILTELGIEAHNYMLVTLHRAENVDREDKLRALIDALGVLHAKYRMPIVCSLHPRTKAKVEQFGVDIERTGLRFVMPFGFFDFIRLEKAAACILSDSGTVQEEACLFGVPNVTLREVTERPETVECGSNVLAGSDPDAILRAVQLVLNRSRGWVPPREYTQQNVAETVVRIVTSYRTPDLAELEWRARARM